METHPWKKRLLYSNCPKPQYLPRYFLCPPRAQKGGHHDAKSIKTTTQRAVPIRHGEECKSGKHDHDAAIQSLQILGSSAVGSKRCGEGALRCVGCQRSRAAHVRCQQHKNGSFITPDPIPKQNDGTGVYLPVTLTTTMVDPSLVRTEAQGKASIRTALTVPNPISRKG